jgi:hypothetical protein
LRRPHSKAQHPGNTKWEDEDAETFTHPNQTHRAFSAGAWSQNFADRRSAFSSCRSLFLPRAILISFLVVISSLSPFRGVYRYINVPGAKASSIFTL